eukprot:9319894-Ditylum_brightwellii.AAC.1
MVLEACASTVVLRAVMLCRKGCSSCAQHQRIVITSCCCGGCCPGVTCWCLVNLVFPFVLRGNHGQNVGVTGGL